MNENEIVTTEMTNPDAKKGSFVAVGTGIDVSNQMTIGARAHIEQADIVYEIVYGKAAKHWINSLNDTVVSLSGFYDEGKSRLQTYRQMEDVMIASVKEGKKVVAAFYGHPGVFATPTHGAIARLKADGYTAWMEPGISAEDCLVADLGIDPGNTGCQAFEASQLLFYKHSINPNCLLIIWQIGLAGEHTLRTLKQDNLQTGLQVLTNSLLDYYPPDHEVIIYMAKNTALFSSTITRIPLSELPASKPHGMSTLVIPSRGLPDMDHETLAKLGLTAEDITGSIDPTFE
ncbi:MAG: hypothetical protein JKY60_10845 [Kordiimonadaceae bacterium]|nr:hypothetical protein [Kordiimonadaceae bacterium]